MVLGLYSPILLGLFTEVYFGVTLDGQNTRFLRGFAFFGAQKPNPGVEFFPDFFFPEIFFDFLTRRCPIHFDRYRWIFVQIMTGE